jgi:hypothetical protein
MGLKPGAIGNTLEEHIGNLGNIVRSEVWVSAGFLFLGCEIWSKCHNFFPLGCGP